MNKPQDIRPSLKKKKKREVSKYVLNNATDINLKAHKGNSPAVQWLGLSAFTAVGPGFNPWSGN